MMMRKTMLLAIILVFAVRVAGQPYQVGHTAVTFTDPARNDRSIPAEIYYPADTEGDDVPFTAANPGAFPVLVFGHGFVMTWSAYANIWNAAVPAGFIIVFPRTETGLAPSHAEFGLDLAFVAGAVTGLGQQPSSLFYGRVDTMNCVMGHSMGGGAAFLAAGLSPAVKAIASLAPAETSPSAIMAAGSLGIPALVIAGGNDCVTPPAAHQLPIYDALQSFCKTYVSITGGSHCQMADYNVLCSIGEMSCQPQPAITREQQHETMFRYLIPWLSFQLKNDCVAGSLFDSLILNDPAVTFLKNCTLCPTTPAGDMNWNYPRVFPNPFGDRLMIAASPSLPSEFVLYDPASRIILRETFHSGLTVNTEKLSVGCYFYEVRDHRGSVASGKLVKD